MLKQQMRKAKAMFMDNKEAILQVYSMLISFKCIWAKELWLGNPISSFAHAYFWQLQAYSLFEV